MVFDLDNLAVGGRPCEPENFAVINPRMTGDDAVGFAGLEKNSRQRIHNL